MKNRFNGNKIAVIVLAVIAAASFTEVILRGILLKEATFNVVNFGEPIIVGLMSVFLLVLVGLKKERLFSVLCAAWLCYFVFAQIYAIPQMFSTAIPMIREANNRIVASLVVAFRCNSMLGVVVVGSLLARYTATGKIHNKAFNIACLVTVGFMVLSMAASIFLAVINNNPNRLIDLANGVVSIGLVVLFTGFAYGKAKIRVTKEKEE